MKAIRLTFYYFSLTAILIIVSCGRSSSSHNNMVPEHKLLQTDVPNVQANGCISPTQNLEYYVEIDHPLLKDSLGILQNYYIDKGKTDYSGVNKIIVRVYLKGASMQGLPYASLFLIGDKKEIFITGSIEGAGFVQQRLADYEVMGCWTVYRENSYVICRKEGQYYAAYIDKKKRSVGELEDIQIKDVKGYTAYYSPNDTHHEYMIIKDDGLYIYDETEESGMDAVIWPNDPSFKR